MTLNFNKRWADYIILSLSVFLVFCLLFEGYIEPPAIVSWLGQWHPLLLHFPIVLLLFVIVLKFAGSKIPLLLLSLAVISALLTATTGFLLGLKSENKGDLLYLHQWLGAGVAFTAVLWYYLERTGYGGHRALKGLGVVLIVFIVFAGHYGGTITHGEDFLALPGSRQKEKIPDNPLIYEHVVNRILKSHCVKCHNPNKTKGELLMTSHDHLLKGGESGSTVIPGDPDKSEIIRRLTLPVDDDDHMPPEGESPLTPDEVKILERWIALGASDTLRLDHLNTTEALTALIKEMMEPDPLEKWAVLPPVADSTLQQLNSDYVTITRLAGTTNAVRVVMYMPPEYDPNSILNLRPISDNIVEFDLSGLPIGEMELGLLAACSNLEWLEIDRTPVTDVAMDTLKVLSKLRLLKVYDTEIGDESVPLFEKWEHLEKLFLWNTRISEKALAGLKSAKPDLSVEDGITGDLETFFVAGDSIPKEDQPKSP